MVDVNGEVIESEHTVTENISTKGATLFTTLQIPARPFHSFDERAAGHHGTRGHSLSKHRRGRHSAEFTLSS